MSNPDYEYTVPMSNSDYEYAALSSALFAWRNKVFARYIAPIPRSSRDYHDEYTPYNVAMRQYERAESRHACLLFWLEYRSQWGDQ